MTNFEHIQLKGHHKGDHYFDGELSYPQEVTLTLTDKELGEMQALLIEMAASYNGIFSEQWFINTRTKEALIFESDLSKEEAEEMREEGRPEAEIRGSNIIHVYYANPPKLPSEKELRR